MWIVKLYVCVFVLYLNISEEEMEKDLLLEGISLTSRVLKVQNRTRIDGGRKQYDKGNEMAVLTYA